MVLKQKENANSSYKINVGKTCLIMSYAENQFPGEYVPEVVSSVSPPYQVRVTVDGRACSISIWDTPGQEEYNRLRPLSYPHTWYPEIKQHCPDTPIVLVGIKLDKRDNSSEKETLLNKSITNAEGMRLAQQVNVFKYLECSAKTGSGVKQVFDEAIGAYLAT
ncbi:ras-related C3 botulinum toxin substrate 1-like isoform X5 [Mercenaria mercenaria]|uniref:ras-related C3 botulinum toxin substrate 1-like isoform X5 n=1 Tax=Mercenaria mercenaria TaxID=6596 RepID=UPI00234EAA02|nr:ras-related C3 botulinum toxin substrate 1-like isoform X5 [Mercenaria mercenaria]